MTRKLWLRLISFILLLVLLTVGLGEALREKGSSFDAYYKLPRNSIDVINVGSSHVYSGVIPAVLWKEYGISSYNVYAWSMPIWTAYYYIKEALKTQKVKIVCLEASVLTYGYESAAAADVDKMNYEQNCNIGFGLNRYELLWSTTRNGDKRYSADELLDISRYHSRWKYLNSKEGQTADFDFLRNYGALFSTIDHEMFASNFYTDVLPPRNDVKTYFEKIVELSKTEGFQLVLTFIPCEQSKEEAVRINWAKQYCEENGIPFLNFMGQDNIANMDYKADMADARHMNYRGAFKVTRVLGEYLSKNYSFAEPEQNRDSSRITQDAKGVYRMFALNDVYSKSDESAYLEWLLKDKASLYCVACANTALLTEAEKQYLNGMGIDYTGASFVAEVDGNKLVRTGADLSNYTFEMPVGSVKIEAAGSGGKLLVNTGKEYDWSSGLAFCFYDYDMCRATYVVNAAQGTISAAEIVQLLRGAA